MLEVLKEINARIEQISKEQKEGKDKLVQILSENASEGGVETVKTNMALDDDGICRIEKEEEIFGPIKNATLRAQLKEQATQGLCAQRKIVVITEALTTMTTTTENAREKTAAEEEYEKYFARKIAQIANEQIELSRKRKARQV
jgi:hypothetical protein